MEHSVQSPVTPTRPTSHGPEPQPGPCRPAPAPRLVRKAGTELAPGWEGQGACTAASQTGSLRFWPGPHPCHSPGKPAKSFCHGSRQPRGRTSLAPSGQSNGPPICHTVRPSGITCQHLSRAFWAPGLLPTPAWVLTAPLPCYIVPLLLVTLYPHFLRDAPLLPATMSPPCLFPAPHLAGFLPVLGGRVGADLVSATPPWRLDECWGLREGCGSLGPTPAGSSGIQGRLPAPLHGACGQAR